MAAMYQASIAAGGSLPLMMGWYSGPFGSPDIVRLEQPAHRALQRGDGVMVEIEGRWGGYVSQIDQSVTFGEVPEWAEDAHKAAVQCWHDVFATIRPGVRFEELRQAAKKIERTRKAIGGLIMHGRGLGDDGPLILPFAGSESRADQDVLVEDTVFVIKPNVTYKGHQNVGHVGETVRVTRSGAERLGTRPIEHYWHVD